MGPAGRRAGDDAYIVEVNQTTVAEAVGGGTDTVYSRADYLAVASEVENFVLLEGAGGLTANRYDNHMTGNDGDNRLNGKGGDDTILGMGGDDTLIGGRGNDSIDGGDGVDTAEFSGNAADYRLSLDGDGSIRVEDTVGNDGVDTLTHVELLGFADQTLSVDGLVWT
ncbi:MAG: hypothetical protein H6844_00295 [Alphaproteobacteria bacterium]|nr:hypothetical protein [Alphaproteobacteria bacterium]